MPKFSDWLERNIVPVLTILACLLLFSALGLLARCDRTAQEQARQTNRSGDAINAAASQAVKSIGDRATTERTIDDATREATDIISEASNPVAIREGVLNAVCSQQSHRNDPACGNR